MARTARCTSAGAGNVGEGNAIDFATCNGTSAQIWAHPDTGGIMNYATGKCVQEGSATSGAQLKQYTCSYNANQTWDYASTQARMRTRAS